MHPAIALVVLRSPLEVGAEQAPEILARASAVLESAGLCVVAPAVLDSARAARAAAAAMRDADVICAIAATWTEDYLVQDLLAALPAPVPVVAWALPGVETGSLCGTQQLCCVLKELDHPYRFLYGEVDDPAALAKLREVAGAATLRRLLRGARIGRVGGRLAGMAEVAVDELALRKTFGVRLVERGLGWLNETANQADEGTAAARWAALCARAGATNVPAAEGIAALRYYDALRAFVDEEELCALTVECYPSLMGRVCLPFALLGEEGIPGACEGDVNAALAMRLLGWLADAPVHNTDLLADDRAENTIVFAHCGSGALCLAEGRDAIALNSCRLMDVGVTAHFTGRPGRVTLLNLVGRQGTTRMSVLTGEAVPTAMVFPGNPVKVRLDAPLPAVLETIADFGLGHHWMIAEGDHAGALREFGRQSGVPVHDFTTGASS